MTTMFITFNPPLGDTTHITSPALFPRSQSIPLLFTARLTAEDYHDLIREGACVQLWSDFPRDNETGWGELDFTEPRNNLSKLLMNPDDSPQSHDSEIKILSLFVPTPTTTSGTCHFSFTYRIAYPSGSITWLGTFGQNGSLVVKQPEENLLNGLVLREGWFRDNIREARMCEIAEGVQSMGVANIDPSEFRIWALSSDRILPQLSNASILFLVPNGRRDSITLNPTYVMSASPNSTLSISSAGCVDASGPGTIFLQTHNIASEAGPFIQQIIFRSELHRWDLLSSHSKSNIALSPPGFHYPQEVVTIPLWSHQGIQLSLNFTDPFAGKRDSDAMATVIFSSSKSQIHVFDNETNDELHLGTGPLGASPTNFRFSICSAYRLWEPPSKTSRNWAVAILTPHNRIPMPLISEQLVILPTPPPSPHLPLISSLSYTPHVPSIADYVVITREASVNHKETSSVSSQISPELVPLAITPSPPKSLVLSLFTSIFASFKSFFALFFKIFLCPLGFGRGQPKAKVESENSRPGNPDESANNSEVEEIIVPLSKDASLSKNLPVDAITDQLTSLEQEGVELKVISSDPMVTIGQQKDQSVALRVMGASEDVFCAELKYDDTQEERSTTATVEIVFIPLPSKSSGHRDIDLVSTTKESLEQAVRFFDGSVLQSGLREVDVFFHDTSANNGGVTTRKGSCYLLQYQLDTLSLKKGRAISILPPVESGV